MSTQSFIHNLCLSRDDNGVDQIKKSKKDCKGFKK